MSLNTIRLEVDAQMFLRLLIAVVPGVLAGRVQSRVKTTPLVDIVGIQKPIDPELFGLAKVLAK